MLSVPPLLYSPRCLILEKQHPVFVFEKAPTAAEVIKIEEAVNLSPQSFRSCIKA